MDKRYEDRSVVYVLLNDKLNRRHMIPQCGHAVAEMTAEFRNDDAVMVEWAKDDRIIVCLKVPGEDLERLDKSDIPHGSFREGHWDDMITGIAFYPMNKREGKALFGNYPLA